MAISINQVACTKDSMKINYLIANISAIALSYNMVLIIISIRLINPFYFTVVRVLPGSTTC